MIARMGEQEMENAGSNRLKKLLERGNSFGSTELECHIPLRCCFHVFEIGIKQIRRGDGVIPAR